MFPPVFQTLKASADVKAIVGTNPPRIYRHGEALQRTPDQAAQPYVTWLLVVGVPLINLSDPPPGGQQTVQVDCWHPTDAGVEVLGDAVKAALEAVTHVTDYQGFIRDADTRMYRVSISADFWGS